MALRYKIDLIEALKEKGYSSYKIRKERIIGERQMAQIRHGEIVSNAILDKLCSLLQCQPGDIIEHIENDFFSDKE